MVMVMYIAPACSDSRPPRLSVYAVYAISSLDTERLGEGCDVTGASGETTQLRLGCQEGDTFEFGLTSARLY